MANQILTEIAKRAFTLGAGLTEAGRSVVAGGLAMIMFGRENATAVARIAAATSLCPALRARQAPAHGHAAAILGCGRVLRQGRRPLPRMAGMETFLASLALVGGLPSSSAPLAASWYIDSVSYGAVPQRAAPTHTYAMGDTARQLALVAEAQLAVNAAVTPFAGGGQASAAPLNTGVTPVMQPASDRDSVQLPSAIPGSIVVLLPVGTNSKFFAVYPKYGSTDTVNGENVINSKHIPVVAVANGSFPAVAPIWFVCVTAGAWLSNVQLT